MALSVNSSTPSVNGSYEGFNYEIYDSNTTTAAIKIFIPANESVKAIPGCMLATSGNMEIKGQLKRTMKAMFGPDSARFQTFTARDSSGWVVLAPSFYGSIKAVPINDEEICVGDDAFLASFGSIESTSSRQSMKKAFFSGHGMYVKKVSGTGIIFICSVGSTMQIELADGEEIIVDTGHLITWPKDISYEVQKASKAWFGSGVSGEGMVSKITGPGNIQVQTRSPEELAEWVYETESPPCPQR